MADPKLTEYLAPLLTVTGLTGGGTNLDGIETVGLVGLRAMVMTGGNVSFYQLQAGTAAESSPGTIRPDDYNGSTNQKNWIKQTPV